MGKNFLIEALRNNGGKGNYFDCNASVISYKTGFPVLDHYLGYKVNVFDKDDKLVDSYSSIGITAGSYIEFIGKPSTSKTTTAVQIGAHIVRPFDNGTVVHFDLEQAMNLSRARTMTKFSIDEIKGGKYILRQSDTSVEKIKRSIIKLYKKKKDNPETFKYNAGKKNELGEDIVVYEPTVVLIDSIPSMTVEMNENDKKDLKKIEEISSQTDRMRLTGEIGRFYTDLLQYIKSVNIITMSINHIKVNPNMGIVKSPAELLYLKQDEALKSWGCPA